jgi:hypothetical protein
VPGQRLISSDIRIHHSRKTSPTDGGLRAPAPRRFSKSSDEVTRAVSNTQHRAGAQRSDAAGTCCSRGAPLARNMLGRLDEQSAGLGAQSTFVAGEAPLTPGAAGCVPAADPLSEPRPDSLAPFGSVEEVE